MNRILASLTLEGMTLDVGGGHSPDYFNYFQRDTDYQLMGSIDGSTDPVDFEKDSLPVLDKAYKTVILSNVLEHVYNYQHLLKEVRRICCGQLIGVVPFMYQYHPDPHDFLRFSEEALKRALTEAGFKEVEITQIEGGPIMANFNNLTLSMPAIVRPMAYIWYRFWDEVFLALRPDSESRCPLGFVFVAR